MKVKVTTCPHKEQVERGDEGIESGKCSICHQVRQYNAKDRREKPAVTKLGRIDGKIVLPAPGEKLLLSAEEAAELDEATKAMASEPVPKPAAKAEAPESPTELNEAPVTKRRGRALTDKDIEENKEAIIRDYMKLTLKEFFQTWHLSSTRWTIFKKLWKVEGKGHGNRGGMQHGAGRPPKSTGTAVEDKAGQLPAFPVFNDSWSFQVQEKWLETYLELRKLSKA